MSQRKVTYRLYPTAAQEAALAFLRWLHCLLWNTALDERRRAWGERAESLSFHDQCKMLTQWRTQSALLRAVNAQSEQVTLKRLHLAFQGFFRRLKAGQKPGFPRFKSPDDFTGWGYKTHGDGWTLKAGEKQMQHGRLRLSGVGEIKIRGKARTAGTPKTCEILYRNGHWYASVTVDCAPAREAGVKVGGLDWGVETFVTLATDDGYEAIDNPRHLKKALRSLRSQSKAISRKEEAAKTISGKTKRFPVSSRLRDAYADRRRLQNTVANQRHDLLHKASATLAKSYGAIAIEKLSIKNMTASGGRRKRGLNRGILDTAPARFHQMLKTKAQEAGSWVMAAPTRSLKPSQRCHGCGNVRKKELKERIHRCEKCGVTCSRDENAARVLLNWLNKELSRTGTVPGAERLALAGKYPSETGCSEARNSIHND